MGISLQHLSEAQRKSIATELFKVTSKEDQKGELHGLCPIHGEKNPSFSYNFKKDVYHCLSCGADGDLLRLWCEVNGLGQKEGFKAFCTKFGIDPGKDKVDTGRPRGKRGGEEQTEAAPVDPGQVMTQMLRAWDLFPPLPEDWLARMEKSRGWSRGMLELLDIRLQTHYLAKNGDLVQLKTPERVAIPVKDVLGRLINIRLYRPGGGNMKIISWAKTTGAAALFPAQPLGHDLNSQNLGSCPAQPDRVPRNQVLLCEGESDTICALSHGFNAITQTSKLKNWPEAHLAAFKGRDVFVAYDADQPGQKYAGFAVQALQKTAKTIRTIQWPSFMGIDADGAYPKDHGQDLTDFIVTHGKTAADLQALLDAAASVSSPPAPAPSASLSPDVLQFFDHGVNNRFSFKPRLLADKILTDLSLLSDPETGLVYRWNNQYWELYDEDQIRKKCLQYLGGESQKSRAEDAAYQVKMLCTIPPDRKINDKMDWICLKNGMFNLRTYAIAPHAPDYYCTYTLPVAFNPDSQERCERWLLYLEQSIQTPEAIAQLQEFLGYCLVRHTRYEKCLLLIGPGSDGKSTFLKIIKELVGDENCAAVSFQDLEDQFQRSSLYNKLVNISTEVGAKAIESPYFKAITSGDAINAAFKHKNGFTFSPYCKLAFAANRLPRVLDNSDGFFRKVLPVRFKRQFLEDDPEKDTGLFDTLKGELSEIFSWAVVGLARLTSNNKFTGSDETRALMQDYRRLNNPVLCYVEDQCVLGDDYEVPKMDLYEDYKKYAAKNGYNALNAAHFFRELYVAVHNLKSYQPRVDHKQKSYLRGIRVDVNVE